MMTMLGQAVLAAGVPQDSDEAFYCFLVCAAVDPGVLPRVIQLFAKRGMVPDALHAQTGGMVDGDLFIQVKARLPVVAARHIADCIGQIPGVEMVQLDETQPAV